MLEQTLDGHMGRPVAIDICVPCQSFWFDARESMQLSPGGTLALFRVIGEHAGQRSFSNADLAKCPRCKARLRLTQDMQRATRFSYLRCPNDHGRLTTFFDFLREKDFIRPLSPQQIAELKKQVQTVNCSNCGGPIDLGRASACTHCGTPVSTIDLEQIGEMAAHLQQAETRQATRGPDFDTLFALLRAERDRERNRDEPGAGIVEVGLQMVAKWLNSA